MVTWRGHFRSVENDFVLNCIDLAPPQTSHCIAQLHLMLRAVGEDISWEETGDALPCLIRY